MFFKPSSCSFPVPQHHSINFLSFTTVSTSYLSPKCFYFPSPFPIKFTKLKKLSPKKKNKLPESRTVFRFTHSAHLQVKCFMSTTWRTYNKQNHKISYRDIPLRATTQCLPFSTLLFPDISLLSWKKSIKSSDVLQRNTSLAICT